MNCVYYILHIQVQFDGGFNRCRSPLAATKWLFFEGTMLANKFKHNKWPFPKWFILCSFYHAHFLHWKSDDAKNELNSFKHSFSCDANELHDSLVLSYCGFFSIAWETCSGLFLVLLSKRLTQDISVVNVIICDFSAIPLFHASMVFGWRLFHTHYVYEYDNKSHMISFYGLSTATDHHRLPMAKCEENNMWFLFHFLCSIFMFSL